MTTPTTNLVPDWETNAVRRLLSRTLGLRNDWDQPTTLPVGDGQTVLRLITALDAAHRVGLGLVAVIPYANIQEDGTVSIQGEPTFAVMRGGSADGALVSLSESAEEWIDCPPTEDGTHLVDGNLSLMLLARSGWVENEPPTVTTNPDLLEPITVHRVQDLYHLDGRPGTPDRVAGNPHNSVLCLDFNRET